MKKIIMISLIITSLPLDASLRKSPTSHSAVAYARLATQEPADDETSPTQYSPSDVELRDLSPVTARVPLTAPADIKTATEKTSTAAAAPNYPMLSQKLSAPTALKDVPRAAQSADAKQVKEKKTVTVCAAAVQQIVRRANLEDLMHKKIAELYPKITLQVMPGTLALELRYQREQLESKKMGQEIALSIKTQFAIEAYCSCIPFFNPASKELIKAKLKAQNPSLSDNQIETVLPEIVKLAIQQKMQEINRKFYGKPRPECADQGDYTTLLNLHKNISALSDPKDRQLLNETVDIVLEEPAPAAPKPQNKKNSETDCIIA